MKAILSGNNDKLVLELESGENKKALIENAELAKTLQKIAETLDFENVLEMINASNGGDESVFPFARIYDSGKPFAFEELEGYFAALKVDENLTTELQEEIRNNYLNDLAASALECVFDNFVYTIFDQMSQLMMDELEIDTKSFQTGLFDRMLDIIGTNAAVAEIKVTLKKNDD